MAATLTVQLLGPRAFPARVKNSDLWQNVDLLRLGEFVTGDRELRCLPAPLIAGNASVLGPLALGRILSEVGRRVPSRTLARFERRIEGRATVALSSPSADVLLGHGLLPWLRLDARMRRVPLLWGGGYMPDDHFDPAPTARQRSRRDARLRSLARRATSVFLSTDDAVARWNAAVGVPPPELTFVLPLFMPHAPRASDVQVDPKPSGRIEILFVGRLARHKNLPALIEALDVLRRSRSFRLTVVSDMRDGPVDVEREYVRHYPRLPREDVLALMRQSHVLAMPSQRESFGAVYVEALASGCAIVAQDRTTQRSMLGECAHYAQPSDPTDVRRALDEAMSTASWTAITERAVERYRDRYAPDVVASAFFDALEATRAEAGR